MADRGPGDPKAVGQLGPACVFAGMEEAADFQLVLVVDFRVEPLEDALLCQTAVIGAVAVEQGQPHLVRPRRESRESRRVGIVRRGSRGFLCARLGAERRHGKEGNSG